MRGCQYSSGSRNVVALLSPSAKPRATESVLVQSAAGGVGLYLVQLLKIMGVKRVIALASSKEKLDLVKSLGADLTFNYSEPDWADGVRAATDGSGVDVVLEAASGEVGEESFKLACAIWPDDRIRREEYTRHPLIGKNPPANLWESVTDRLQFPVFAAAANRRICSRSSGSDFSPENKVVC